MTVTTRRERERRAWQQGLTAVLLWSTVATAFKLTLAWLSPSEAVALAGLVSWIALMLLVVAQGLWPQFLYLRRRDWLQAAALGMLNPVAYYLMLLAAYDLLPAQVAQAVNYTWTIALVLLAIPLLGQRLTRSKATALALGYLGMLIITIGAHNFGSRPLSLTGLGLAFGSTLIWALYWLCTARIRIHQTVLLLAVFSTALPWLALTWILSSGLQLPPWPGLAGGVYIGLLEMGLTFVLWGGALRLTEHASRLAQLVFLSPFLSLVWIWLVLGEEIVPTTPIGMLFVVAGICWHERASRQ